MADTETPQIYLITPPEFDLNMFPQTLDRVLDRVDVACIRLALSSQDEDHILRAADAVRDVAHRFDIALVLDTHVVLAQRLGLDGVHLLDGARSVRWARTQLGDDAIVGAYCAQSRHDGMAAGESGADYISFGPVGQTALGDGAVVDPELFAWWSEVIELPCVAEGALDQELVASLSPVTDFFAFGAEIWGQDDPAAALADFVAAMGA